MQKRVGQEVAKTRLLAQIAMGADSDEKWTRTINNVWNEYLRATYYLDAEHEDLERNMQEQYNKFKHLRPQMTIQKDGSLKVTGIPKTAI